MDRTPRISCRFFAVMLLTAGCDPRHGDSAMSVADARQRELLVVEYAVPADSELGDYRVLEVWVEAITASADTQLVVRLKGPHHGGTHRVRVVGLDESDYRGIWSDRDGPPYERWTPPEPLPETLTLERDGAELKLTRKI